MDIVLHDYFESAEGGGRLSLILAQAMGADLAYGFKVKNHPFFEEMLLLGKQYKVSSFTDIQIWRQYKIARAFAGRTGFLKDYHTAIYSGFYTPLAVYNHPVGRNIYYCHTPPRFLYDQKDFYLSLIKPWQRPILETFNRYLQPKYEAAVKKMDLVIANSKNVQARIGKYLGIDSQIIHPPCDVDQYKWLSQGDYYLSTARLDPLKRVDLVIDAFKDLPEKKLIMASGGPELEKIIRLTDKIPNIEVLGWVSEDELHQLIGNCLATIYIPVDEDFGMSPVESMAAGKPVIGVAEGGLQETIIHGETGHLIPSEPSLVDIIEGVLALSSEKALKMRSACEERARMFRKEVFIEKMQKIIDWQGSGQRP